MARRVHGQLEFKVRTWGGARRGAGRRATGKFGLERGKPKAGISHRPRKVVAGKRPLHVTVRTVEGVPSLRREEIARAIGRTLKAAVAKGNAPARVVQFSLLGNHIHFLVEAEDRAALGEGMRIVLIRVAMAVNRAAQRAGRVFRDRFHARELLTPREVRHVLVYILRNGRKHGYTPEAVDDRSSGAWFDGWKEHDALRNDLAPVSPARTWLITVGWKRSRCVSCGQTMGLLSVDPSVSCSGCEQRRAA